LIALLFMGLIAAGSRTNKQQCNEEKLIFYGDSH